MSSPCAWTRATNPGEHRLTSKNGDIKIAHVMSLFSWDLRHVGKGSVIAQRLMRLMCTILIKVRKRLGLYKSTRKFVGMGSAVNNPGRGLCHPDCDVSLLGRAMGDGPTGEFRIFRVVERMGDLHATAEFQVSPSPLRWRA